MNETFQEFLKNLTKQKIAIIGAGVSNIPLIQKLVSLNCDLTLFDQKEEENLNEEMQKLIQKGILKASLGKEYLERLNHFDIIFRSPSFLPSNSYLRKEKSRGAIITSEI